ncbi:histidine phosphatase superfamily [Apiospora kogelbergensis]|uniref:Histidine phosphatase superfamily n=1 Tax=Apiospora kogelbergensis TaxID=1337665 RepID=A0AAW0R7I1_9PEZI
MATQERPKLFNFECLKGFFMTHPSMKQDPAYALSTHADLGLIPQSYGTAIGSGEDSQLSPWQCFANHVERLNRNAKEGELYKVLYVGRHGQGFHNVMEAKVGTPAWESHWALLDGDGDAIWADSELTNQGKREATDNAKVWRRLIEQENMPWPALYCSPLQRCLETARLSFEDLAASKGKIYQPMVKENLRERMGRHTCDRRSSRTWIREHYPSYLIEPGFTEKDELFEADRRETDEEHVLRTRIAMDELFEHEASYFVSITMHSMASRMLMRVIGQEEYRMSPGSTTAFFVKATRI